MKQLCDYASSFSGGAFDLDLSAAEFVVSARRRKLQFKQPAGTSRGVMLDRTVWYVSLSYRSGERSAFGIGECAPLPGLSCDDVPDYEPRLREACAEWQRMGRIPYASLQDFPSILMGFETAARSLDGSLRRGDEFAVWDSPFYDGDEGILINGLVWMGTAEEMQARMDEKLAVGFRCVKLKIGALDFDRELDLIRSLRERYPPSKVELRLDANGAFPEEEAISRLRRLAAFGIHSIEQPIRAGRWEEMARICRESPIPVALDEELIGVNRNEERRRLLDTIRPHYIILKPTLHGAFSGCAEWERLAAERGIGFWYTSALESNVGLNAIAQWSGRQTADGGIAREERPKLPQGLGTGQLFVDNFERLTLSIEGEHLFLRSKEERFRREVDHFEHEWKDPDVATIVMHTSGSTGDPQPMSVAKEKMRAGAMRSLHALGIRPSQTALLCLPMRYVAGKMMWVRAAVGNLQLRLVAPSLHPFAELEEAPDFAALTPQQAAATLSVGRERALLEATGCVLLGGARVDDTLARALQTCRGAVWSSYGMTETLSHIALRRVNGESRSECYVPLDGVNLHTDGEGCLVIDDEVLGIRGLATHDLAALYEDGTFRIIGRTDNVVNSGGLKLQVESLENRLRALPFRFVLTGVADAALGEALSLLIDRTSLSRAQAAAWQCTIDGRLSQVYEDEVRELCRTYVEKKEVPKYVFVADGIPHTETGKPARLSIRRLVQSLVV